MQKVITHLITGLGKGGAEAMLYQILKYRTDTNATHQVISFGASHYYEADIQKLGISIIELPLRRRPISSLSQLLRLLRRTDTLCCWMYHANFGGYPAAKLSKVPRIVWCIRHSNLDPTLNKKTTLFLNRICARWSKHVDAIAYNGESARQVHEAIGYASEKGCILDNGCDISEYAPNSGARADLCKILGIDCDNRIIFSATKDAPIKDVPTFLRAFGLLHRARPQTVAVLCGIGIEPGNKHLEAVCTDAGLQIGKDVFFLGLRHDMPRLLAACDLYVLHSLGEAFPNVLLQAMSCGCLCIATDVGDSRRILADDDCILPPGNTGALAKKMEAMLMLPEEDSQKRRIRNREIVRERFDIQQIVRQYEEIF